MPRLMGAVLSASLILTLTSAPAPRHRCVREEGDLSGRAVRLDMRFEGTRLECGSD